MIIHRFIGVYYYYYYYYFLKTKILPWHDHVGNPLFPSFFFLGFN
ncbi:MAG: hypothetical protein N7Q72_03210 [Spiroplasma sp. Tabriz.8]|nr:hypothetical protein [Spiroplasma sp. Tabriz.8]